MDVGVKYKSTVSWQGCLNAKNKPYPKMVSKFAKYQKKIEIAEFVKIWLEIYPRMNA